MAIAIGSENNALSVGSPSQAGDLSTVERQPLRFAPFDRLQVKIAGTARARPPANECESIAARRERRIGIPFVTTSRHGQTPLLSAFHIDQVNSRRFLAGGIDDRNLSPIGGPGRSISAEKVVDGIQG